MERLKLILTKVFLPWLLIKKLEDILEATIHGITKVSLYKLRSGDDERWVLTALPLKYLDDVEAVVYGTPRPAPTEGQIIDFNKKSELTLVDSSESE